MIRTSAALLALAATVACAGGSAGPDRAAPTPPPPTAGGTVSPGTAERAARQAQAAELAAAEPGAAVPSPGARLFAELCSACHTVGRGPSVGPDLAGVTERRDREWLVRWIRDPIEMGRTDATGRELLREWNGFTMPDLGLTEEEARLVVAWLEAPDETGLGRGGHGCMRGQGGGGGGMGMGMRMRMRHGAEGGAGRGESCGGGGMGMHGRGGGAGGPGGGMMCGSPVADTTGAERPSH